MNFAGFPATLLLDWIDLLKLQAIPTKEFSPILIPSEIVELGPIQHPLPIFTLPQMSACAPICTPLLIAQLCATWTWSFNFVYSPIIVGWIVPEQIVFKAPISTSFCISTPPMWGRWICSRDWHEIIPKPGAPIVVFGLIITLYKTNDT